MFRISAACLCVLIKLGSTAHCEERAVPAPVFSQGDSWVFQETTEKGPSGFDQRQVDQIIERLDGATMVVGLKRDGAPTAYEDHILRQDWSQLRIVNGEQVVTFRPFSFPMRVGKSWSVDVADTVRRGNVVSNHVRRTYTVIGWEDVTVPAGVFHALKIEAKGVDEYQVELSTVATGGAAAQSTGAATFTQTHRGGRGTVMRSRLGYFYYAPAVRNYVQHTDEQYNQDGVQVVRTRSDLVAYRLAN